MKYLGAPQSGSQANTTASHNRAGQYYRSRRKPITPTRNSKQGVIRGMFGAASAAWQSLEAGLQAAWSAFAASYPVTDSLGQSLVLTGQQYFIGLQTSLMNAGQIMNLNVPVNTSMEKIANPLLVIDGQGVITVSVDSLKEGDFVIVGLSSVKSAGVSFCKAFSQFAVLTHDVPSLDVTEEFTDQFGAPVVGRKVFACFKYVNSAGMTGSPIILTVLCEGGGDFAPPVLTRATSGHVKADWIISGAVTVDFYLESDDTLIETYTGSLQTSTMTLDESGVEYYAIITQGEDVSGKSNVVRSLLPAVLTRANTGHVKADWTTAGTVIVEFRRNNNNDLVETYEGTAKTATMTQDITGANYYALVKVGGATSPKSNVKATILACVASLDGTGYAVGTITREGPITYELRAVSDDESIWLDTVESNSFNFGPHGYDVLCYVRLGIEDEYGPYSNNVTPHWQQ
ncbi:MAG: hypothetical protein WCL08_05025 [Verrucomicrobiota bacterium]